MGQGARLVSKPQPAQVARASQPPFRGRGERGRAPKVGVTKAQALKGRCNLTPPRHGSLGLPVACEPMHQFADERIREPSARGDGVEGFPDLGNAMSFH